MAKIEKAPKAIKDFALDILSQYETHKPILDAKVNIEFLFAYGERHPETDALISDAITKHGFRCDGICRKTNAEERAAGRGDAVIMLDADWWEKADEAEQKALLDHELHHIDVCTDEEGKVIKDKGGRPRLRMRKHDVEIGWFKIIAERNGQMSGECRQAKVIMDHSGQAYWPYMFEDKAQPAQEAKPVAASPFSQANA
jgi:hypothetical protein